ncbi:hypothetical protein DVS77_21655 [Mycolicibacterium moriokaense]|nr:hypothetical protein DVS77_21655 [Mycolicibacterium moriokaense]
MKLSQDQAEVFIALKMSAQPMCDKELLTYLQKYTLKGANWKINMVNGRRHDLLEMDKIEEAGRWSCRQSSYRVIHWRVKE